MNTWQQSSVIDRRLVYELLILNKHLLRLHFQICLFEECSVLCLCVSPCQGACVCVSVCERACTPPEMHNGLCSAAHNVKQC